MAMEGHDGLGPPYDSGEATATADMSTKIRVDVAAVVMCQQCGIPIGADAGADLTYSGPVEVREHRSNHSEHAGTTDWLKRERSG
jgi:hypothetical protein